MNKDDEDRIKKDSDRAKDYFAKMPGFQASQAGRPAPPPPAAEEKPAVPAKPEPPLTEAEKYFKKLLG
jgi:hypothetical protein